MMQKSWPDPSMMLSGISSFNWLEIGLRMVQICITDDIRWYTDNDNITFAGYSPSPSTDLVMAANVPFLLQVLQEIKMMNKDDQSTSESQAASEVVAAFCVMHTIDANEFARLTESDLLPFISSQVV